LKNIGSRQNVKHKVDRVTIYKFNNATPTEEQAVFRVEQSWSNCGLAGHYLGSGCAVFLAPGKLMRTILIPLMRRLPSALTILRI
jgi:hypothetical protein